MNSKNNVPITKKKIGSKVEEKIAPKKKRAVKKVLYIEIDDEVTGIYDKIKSIRMKNIYLILSIFTNWILWELKALLIKKL